MPEAETLDDDPNAPETDLVTRSRKDLRGLERAAKEGRAAQQEALALRRELALAKAGIPESGPGRLFIKAYDGELTQEAIKAAAEEYGIFDSTNSIPQSELDAQARMSQNAASGITDPNVDINAELNAANNESEVLTIARKYGLKGIDLRTYGG